MTLKAATDGNDLVFTVTDTGVGIAPGGAGPDLREVPAGREPDDPRAGRHRAGAVDRARAGEAAAAAT